MRAPQGVTAEFTSMADILSYSLEEGRGVRQPLHASLFSTWKHIVRPLYGVVCSPPPPPEIELPNFGR